MRVLRSLQEVPIEWSATVLTIGNFDGVHRGHQHVLDRVATRARQLGIPSLAVTFEPHPLRILRPERAPALITPLRQKLAAFERTNIDAVLVLPFDDRFASLSPREFVQNVIVERLRAKEVHEGLSFRFGYRAEGTGEKLRELGREFTFDVVIYPEMRWRGETVSSSRVRQLISEGNVSRARQLLGRPFSILSTPAKGRGYGSRYTVPTINLAHYSELVPQNGVYVTCTRVAQETFESLTNIGVRPTFDGAAFAIETHLLNFHPMDLSESTEVEITFLQWLRPEIKWPDSDALKQQIGRDIHKARRFFSLCSVTSEKQSKRLQKSH